VKQYIVFFAVCCIILPSTLFALDGLPGSTWGSLEQDFQHPGKSDAILQGWIRQGIAWDRWQSGGTTVIFTTYGTVRYNWDSQGLSWNNYFAPGMGASLDFYIPSAPQVSAGVERIYQLNYRAGNSTPYTAPFINWYHWWDILNNGYPGSTWGDLRWEVPDTGASDLILQGWIRQGISIKRWNAGANTFVLNPYLTLHYKKDSQDLDWDNYIAPGAGIALDMGSAKGPVVSWGAEYTWQDELRSKTENIHMVSIYMRWYGWWNLKH